MKPSILILFTILFSSSIAMETPVIKLEPQCEPGVFGPFQDLNIFTLVYQGGSLVMNRQGVDNATFSLNGKEATVTEAEVKEIYLLFSAAVRTLKMLPAKQDDEIFSISINSPNGSLIIAMNTESVLGNQYLMKLKSKLDSIQNEK